ncbi:MAG: hypothetical protein DYG91_04990 [Chloroflexi bacterium CFX7]|nr:hypothetical protein [Chloroflexi bacterium CFX7]RIL01485.1 MAG: hypothetical protein DCC78_10810 [bacterium]
MLRASFAGACRLDPVASLPALPNWCLLFSPQGRRPVHALVEQNRPEIERLCRRFHVREPRLFGSAARDEDRPDRSDADFLVEFEQLPSAAMADCYFGLLEAMERHLQRPVGVVVAEAVSNPYFRAAAGRSAVRVYAA